MQTLLTIDIGNTDLKFGLFVGQDLRQHWRLEGWRQRSESLNELLPKALAQAQEPFDAVAYSSVASEVEKALQEVLHQAFSLDCGQILNINPNAQPPGTSPLRLPVDFSCYAAGQLGTDRLVNVCGAKNLYPKEALIIVDFGTATTFDLINAEGLYLGGAITPGLLTFSQSLSEKTAQLPPISLIEKRFDQLALGINTLSCLEAGLGLGYRGLVLELLKVSQARLEEGAYRVLCTGGLAKTVCNLCGLETTFSECQPTLTLWGLAGLARLNQ
jgi:type III pantothenate kinase